MAKTFLSSDPIQVEAALRTHLAEVSLASQTLMRRCRDEQDLKCLSVIGRASLRLERMVHQFELARRLEDEDERRTILTETELTGWGRSLTAAAAESLTAAEIGVEFSCDLPALVTVVDAELLDWMVCELISNAAKAVGRGGTVTVGLKKTESSAVITVTDGGEGFSEEAMNRVFGEEIPCPDLTPGAGAGLGLRLARVIAELHGGLIMVDSAPGKGVRAAVALPLRLEARARLNSPRPIQREDLIRTALSDALPAGSLSGTEGG